MAERHEKYQLYVTGIWDLLKECGVDTPEMVYQLTLECETALKAHEKKYHGISNRVFDMFIGVPLGALVASVIYAENNVAPVAIVFIILTGFAISGLVKLIQSIFFYSEGYFKDKYLLEVLKELNYSKNLHKPEKL